MCCLFWQKETSLFLFPSRYSHARDRALHQHRICSAQGGQISRLGSGGRTACGPHVSVLALADRLRCQRITVTTVSQSPAFSQMDKKITGQEGILRDSSLNPSPCHKAGSTLDYGNPDRYLTEQLKAEQRGDSTSSANERWCSGRRMYGGITALLYTEQDTWWNQCPSPYG